MPQKVTLFFATLAPAFSLLAPSAFAGGYRIYEKSAHGLGRAFAGEAAAAHDASTIGSNPAGMSRLKGVHFSLSAAAVESRLEVRVEEANSIVPALAPLGLAVRPLSGRYFSGNATPGDFVIPAAYAAVPLNDEMYFGLGVFSDFASKTEYQADFVGSLLALSSDIRTVNVNPSFSYELNRECALGIGLSAVYIRALLSAANPAVGPLQVGNIFPLNPETYEIIQAPNGEVLGTSKMQGETWGVGWNVGVLLEPLKGTRFGLTYRSEVETEVRGDVTFDGVPDVDIFNDFEGYAPITLPAIASLSYVQALGAGLSFSADITQTAWSTFKELRVYREDNNVISSQVPEDWQNANRYSAGLDLAISENFEVRGGYAFDETPTPNYRRTLRIPTGDMRWYTFGGSYRFGKNASVDLGYAFVRMTRTGINDERGFIGQSFYNELRATAKSQRNIMATQLNVSI